MRHRRVLAAAFALAVLSGCGGESDTATGGNGQAGGNEVEVVDFLFKPAQLTVQRGEEVRWRFEDQAPHTATAEDKSFDSGNKQKGETYSHRFDQPGTFPYICTLHPQMRGTITVS